ncbi:hypothetical protein [Microbacterium sp. 77mftsu3.1]|uniref:hypothetical protein n=1 Tax=Microbacterium sp. 77mftsu3.1 TaxID=1761802 RepID=UPI00036BCA49|nr:hypothetical protein [Microbacterium sp. 77mftsu3.1]SDH50538.1 hypothetical protein SAMN04488590_3470 [Microbacterium sp. 77mftsu3.1]
MDSFAIPATVMLIALAVKPVVDIVKLHAGLDRATADSIFYEAAPHLVLIGVIFAILSFTTAVTSGSTAGATVAVTMAGTYLLAALAWRRGLRGIRDREKGATS